MSMFSLIVVGVMTAFAVLGIVDNLFLSNKLGIGEEFQKGIEMIGPLCLAITGIISLVPMISWLLENTISPLYQKLGLDPSFAVTSILAIDMGGFQLAESVAVDPIIGKWAGIIYGSMMGATIVFSIPVGLAAIRKEDTAAFAKGTLFGIAAIPVGTLVGGLMLGVPFVTAIKNLILPVVFSIIITLCLVKYPNQTSSVFSAFSTFINGVAMIGLALAMIKDLILVPVSESGAFDIDKVPVFNLVGPTSEGIGVAGAVGLVLSGALPFVACINKWFKGALTALSKKLGMSESGITGFLLSSANNMAMFATFEKMGEKEQILNAAFAVCASFVIGDHLAFTAANAPDCIGAMMASKIVSGIIAVAAAAVFTGKKKKTK